MKKTRGLGRGLNELLASTASRGEDGEEVAGFKMLAIERLVPGAFQPRLSMQKEGLSELAESIKTQGMIQPIVVRKKPASDDYEIIAGERRWRAAQIAQLYEVPVIIKELCDRSALVISLVENIQRENLNPMEEAHALKRLADDLGFTHAEVAQAVGKSRAGVSNFIRLLLLNKEVQSLLEQGSIEMGHARALLGVKGELQLQAATQVVSQKLSVRETEKLVARLQLDPVEKVVKPADPDVTSFIEALTEKIGARVSIRHQTKGAGALLIHYHSLDELEGIMEHIV